MKNTENNQTKLPFAEADDGMADTTLPKIPAAPARKPKEPRAHPASAVAKQFAPADAAEAIAMLKEHMGLVGFSIHDLHTEAENAESGPIKGMIYKLQANVVHQFGQTTLTVVRLEQIANKPR